MINRVIQERFDRLAKQANQILSEAKQQVVVGDVKLWFVDHHNFMNWTVKVKALLTEVCGKESEYFKEFEKRENPTTGQTNYDILRNLEAIFLGAKEDFDNGYLLPIRALIQAEVFDSELEQAEELLKSGYSTSAAVIAGIVLETALRELCDKRSIPHGKLDRMNADLTKDGAYSLLMQKEITKLAHIRNSAAHGKSNEFNDQQVQNMIQEIRQFLAKELVT